MGVEEQEDVGGMAVDLDLDLGCRRRNRYKV
jgi:hypothetical protein